MNGKPLGDEYTKLTSFPTVKTWMNALSESKATKRGALYSLYRYVQHTGKNPDQLIDSREKELSRKSTRLRFETEDQVREFAKKVRGAQVYAAYLKSFYRANHLPLDLKLVRPPPQREPVGIPDDERLRALVNASGSKQLKALILFLIDSGARIGSVLKLQYRHIKPDFEAGNLPIAIHFPSAITKGNIPYVGFIGEDAAQALRDYLEWRSTDRQTRDVHGRTQTLKGRKLTDDSYLFESRNGKPLSETTTIQRITQGVAYQAGLNQSKKGLKEFHPHLLRARFQTVMEGQGIPLNWVDLMLGHIPRGAQGAAYSKPSEKQLRDCYIKAYRAFRIFKPPASEEQLEALQSRAQLEQRLALLEAAMGDVLRQKVAASMS